MISMLLLSSLNLRARQKLKMSKLQFFKTVANFFVIILFRGPFVHLNAYSIRKISRPSLMSEFEGTSPSKSHELSIETRIVAYNPCEKDPHGATSMPIYQTATFQQIGATTFGEYDYTRSGNPTRDALQNQIASLGSCTVYSFNTVLISKYILNGNDIDE